MTTLSERWARSATTRQRTTREHRERLGFVAVVVLLTWVGREFGSNDGEATLWFEIRVAGVPVKYLVIFAVLGLMLQFVLRAPRARIGRALRRSKLAVWVGLGSAAVLFAFLVAVLESAPEPFADWRNLLLTGIVAAMAARWLAPRPWKVMTLLDLSIAYGLLSFIPLAIWGAGRGTEFFGMRIPMFDGPHLHMASFTALITITAWMTVIKRFGTIYATGVRAAAVGSSLLVVLSFRRGYWTMIAVGAVVIMIGLIRKREIARSRVVGAVALGLVALTVVLAGGADAVVSERLVSFLPNAENDFAKTNEDHVNDVIDAVGVVADEPILGFGIGKDYQTTRITQWKQESFDVHNAYVHVWLKFGLLGMIAYVGFHLRWMAGLLRAPVASRTASIVLFACGAFLLGELIATIPATWPYGKVQMAVHHGVMLGVFLSIYFGVAPADPSATLESVRRNTARLTG